MTDPTMAMSMQKMAADFEAGMLSDSDLEEDEEDAKLSAEFGSAGGSKKGRIMGVDVGGDDGDADGKPKGRGIEWSDMEKQQLRGIFAAHDEDKDGIINKKRKCLGGRDSHRP